MFVIVVSCVLYSPVGEGLTSWLSCVLGQMWYLIVLSPDLYLLSDFAFHLFLLFVKYFKYYIVDCIRPTIYFINSSKIVTQMHLQIETLSHFVTVNNVL